MRFFVILCLLLVNGCSFIQEGDSCYSCIKRHKAHFAGDSWKHYRIKNRFGVRTYKPLDDYNYNEVGMASWYGDRFHQKKTASGMVYDMHKFSAAHRTLPLPCLAKVTNLENGKEVIVLVNDRGPFVAESRIIDLSVAAAKELDFYEKGLAKVKVEVLEDHTKNMIAHFARLRANKSKPTT